MLKFRDIMLPALGGTGVLLGAAYGISSRDYQADKVELLTARVGQLETQAAQAKEQFSKALSSVADAEVQAASAVVDLEMTQEQLIAAENKLAAAEQRANDEAARAAMLAEKIAQSGTEVATTAPVVMASAPTGALGLGRVALPQEIAAWDKDVLPDGRGLPEGRGDVLTGEEVFAEKCASCHGDFAEGVDNWPVLAGGFDTLGDKDPVKTVGSYWPYLSTVWDYVNRSMPFGAAQTLEPDEVYAITAYILYSNDLVDDDFELSHENFADFQMYNTGGFVVDDRASVEYTKWRAEPCMANCKDAVEITMHASVLDVTPEEAKAAAEPEVQVASTDTPAASTETPTPTTEATDTSAPAEAVEEPSTPVVAAVDPALVEKGEKVFKKCKACHQVGDKARNRTGPVLNGIVGASMGGVVGFKYSKAFQAANAEGRVWDAESMTAFLSKPKKYMKGTKMSFAGLKKHTDIDAIIAYLQSQGG